MRQLNWTDRGSALLRVRVALHPIRGMAWLELRRDAHGRHLDTFLLPERAGRHIYDCHNQIRSWLAEMSVYNTSPQPTCLHRACLQGLQVAPTEQQSNKSQTCFRGTLGSLHASLHRGVQHSGRRQFKAGCQNARRPAATHHARAAQIRSKTLPATHEHSDSGPAAHRAPATRLGRRHAGATLTGRATGRTAASQT